MSTEAEEIPFGKWLRNQRRSLDLSRQALADGAGCAEITLRRIESGSLKPSKELAAILLSKVGIPEAEHAAWIRFARGLSGIPGKQDEPAASRPRSHMPVFLTSFVGREKEQAEILQLLNVHRLVTLAGPGGVGKTRLAGIVGANLQARFPDGIWMVELASLAEPGLVPQNVAAPFGIASRSSAPCAELLLNYLSTREALIILDNCEHLLTACADLVDLLLKNCPKLSVLATSREALQVAGEAVYRVPPMTIPEGNASIKRYRESQSIRLFEERAQLAEPEFSLRKENIGAIAQICRELDGIPLAIELAAARVDIFSVEQIASRLRENFDLLSSGSRTLPPRQQTIRGSFDWSWNLLSEEERLLLCRLSIFSGGWTLAGAETMCARGKLEGQDAAILLIQLAAKSLIVASRVGRSEMRYNMHELIRQYAREKLDPEEEALARGQHLEYFTRLSQEAAPALYGPGQMEWVAWLRVEQDNLRSALKYAAGANVRAGLLIIGQLGDNLDLREGLRWAAKFLETPQSHQYPHPRAKALLAYAGYLWYTQQFEAARRASEEGLELMRSCGDRVGEFEALMHLGGILQMMESMDRKTELHQRGLAIARELGDEAMQAWALDSLGWDRRDPQRSYACWDEALALYRKLGNWRQLAFLLGVYGDTLLANGEPEAAQKLLDESAALGRQINARRDIEFVLVARARQARMSGRLSEARAALEKWTDIAEQIGNRMGYLWGRARLGYVAALEGNYDQASEILSETARQFYLDHNKVGLAFTLERLAFLLTQTGRHASAARLIAWAGETRREMGDPRSLMEETEVDRDIAACESSLGEEAFTAALAAGRSMTFDEAFDLAVEPAHPSRPPDPSS